MGIKAGVTLFNTAFNDISLASGDFTTDPTFSENNSSVFPNVGAGLFLFSDAFYFGLSTPNFLRQKHLEEQNGINALGSEELHVFTTAGYVIPINENLKLKPSFMNRFVLNAPLSLDVNVNALFMDRFELGLSHRLGDSFALLTNVAVTPSLRLGYAYDYTANNLGEFSSGTHEIFVLYNLNLGSSASFVSPRFF